jgi:hypothetical protein
MKNKNQECFFIPLLSEVEKIAIKSIKTLTLMQEDNLEYRYITLDSITRRYNGVLYEMSEILYTKCTEHLLIASEFKKQAKEISEQKKVYN